MICIITLTFPRPDRFCVFSAIRCTHSTQCPLLKFKHGSVSEWSLWEFSKWSYRCLISRISYDYKARNICLCYSLENHSFNLVLFQYTRLTALWLYDCTLKLGLHVIPLMRSHGDAGIHKMKISMACGSIDRSPIVIGLYWLKFEQWDEARQFCHKQRIWLVVLPGGWKEQ